MTWATSKYGMNIPRRLAPSVNLIGVITPSLLVMTAGVFSRWDVMTK
jgi:hypothetical protein